MCFFFTYDIITVIDKIYNIGGDFIWHGILGIVSEYNPFHNGHLRHLDISKQLTNADFTIAIMSGNFVQRGDTALVDKWTRAEMALRAGVDLVIELPVLYSLSSAENFADGAVKILNSLGIVNYLSFGSEIGDLDSLNEIATVLYKEPKELSGLIMSQVRSGLSYPKARELAISQYFGFSKKYSEILKNPNNILGIEYLKALKRRKCNIAPLTIKREYSDYNSTSIKNGVTSATAIREMIKQNKNVHYVVPYETFELLERQKEKGQIITDLSVFEKEIIYILRKLTLEELKELPDVSEGLENKIKAAANSCNTLEELISCIKSKRYTQTRIQRILLYALLGITDKNIELSRKTTPYIRVLGFNKNGKKMISAISRANPKLNVIVSVKRFMELSNNLSLKLMLSKDVFSSNVYTLGYKKEPLANLDYTHKIVEI